MKAAALLLVAAATPGIAAIAPAAEAPPCSVTGVSNDIDPAGLRVHRGPDIGSEVIGVLLPGMDPEAYFHDGEATLADGLVGAQFTVEAVAGDWLRIGDIDAVTDGINPDGSLEARPNFQGTGWVHASKVELQPSGPADGHQRPDKDSPVSSPNMNFGTARIVGCQGDWAELRDSAETGWVLSGSNKAHAATMRRALRSSGDQR